MADLSGTTLDNSARLRAWAIEVVASHVTNDMAGANNIINTANKLVQFVLTGNATPAVPATLTTTQALT